MEFLAGPKRTVQINWKLVIIFLIGVFMFLVCIASGPISVTDLFRLP